MFKALVVLFYHKTDLKSDGILLKLKSFLFFKIFFYVDHFF